MNWEAIGAVGEVVGAVAVVGTLAYLAVQIRAQARDAKLAAVQTLTSNIMEAYSGLMEPQLADVWVRGGKDFDSLAEAEKIQLVGFLHKYFRVVEAAYYQAAAGGLAEPIRMGIVRHTGTLLSTSAATRIWAMRKRSYSDEFQDFVDGIEPGKYLFE